MQTASKVQVDIRVFLWPKFGTEYQPQKQSQIWLFFPTSGYKTLKTQLPDPLWQEKICLFVLRFYGPVNPMGHVEHGQFT